ncbi:MAG: ATP-binding cassette domain-containing protein, partial [Lachnospiraceae bacterium]|nr:ATP-binding cassette domain-containing protein [Lachnospiraceae bacterium]
MDYIMELERLSKSYGGKKVVDSFSLKMEKGHIYGLIGPNGAGKTTVMKM